MIRSPIKTHGIKTKLAEWIVSKGPKQYERILEPFCGSAVVALNSTAKEIILNDSNPAIIKFMGFLKNNFSEAQMQKELKDYSALLHEGGDAFYKATRARFNSEKLSLEEWSYMFTFLNHSSFNGVIRFNSKGEFNVPFGKNNNKFSDKYITKICERMEQTQNKLVQTNAQLFQLDFKDFLMQAKEGDFVYCDPPYLGRITGYTNQWSAQNEKDLFLALDKLPCDFALSTWLNAGTDVNPSVEKYWRRYNLHARSHKYIVGPKNKNRPAVLEGLVTNF